MMEFIKNIFNKSKKILMKNDFKLLSSWAREFIGRTNELKIFKNLVTDDDPDRRIIAIHGISGVGKTILLTRFYTIASSFNAKMVISDNYQKSIIETMNKFADDLELLGIKLLSFQKEYKRFSKLNYEVLTDQNKPEKIFEWLGHGVAELGSIVSKMDPTAERIMQMGGKETIEYATKEISSYLYKKFSREDVNLLLTPTRLLTKAFVNNLKEITSTKKIFLCFDDYQETQFFLGDWLLNALLPLLMRLNNVYLIISSQKKLPDKWLKYIPIICQMPLFPFNREETASFLAQKGIKNKDDIDELFTITKGLPLSLQWQTISPIGVGDSFSRNNRYLISIPVNLRESVLMCTIPRHFNKDIIESLSPSLPAKEVFDFTIKLPGIYIKGDFWEFHEEIRKSLMDYKRKESPKEYIDYHQRVYTYYKDIVQTNIDKDSKFQYTNKWWKLEIESLYHYLIIDEAVAIQQFYNLFSYATAHWLEDTLNALITLIKSVDIKSENRNTVNLLIDSKLAIDKNNFPKAIDALNFLSNLEKVPLEEKCIILISIGIIYRKHMRNKLDQAEHKFKEVMNRLPNHSSAYEELAGLYLDEEKDEKAIEVYRFMADTIKDSKISAFYNIGKIYLEKGNYKNVENTLKELAKLSKDCVEQYILLGAMKEKQKAWDDAIEIHKLILQKFPKYTVEAKYNIAKIYLSLEKAEEVHGLAKGLIKGYPDSPEGYHLMAAYYNMIGDEKEELSMLYELSKRSLDLAIPLLFQKSIEMGKSGRVDKLYKMLQDFEDISIEDNILVGNSYLWRLIGEKKKSIAVLKRVLQQNPSSIISYCNLADIYWEENDLDKALFYLEKAFSLDSKAKSIVDPLLSLYEIQGLNQKLEKLNGTYSDTYEDNISILNHSLIGRMHIEKEFVKIIPELKKELSNNPNDLLLLGILLVAYMYLDKLDEYLRMMLARITSTLGDNKYSETLSVSIEKFINTEKLDTKKLVVLSNAVLMTGDFEKAYNHLSLIKNQMYKFLGERFLNIGFLATRTGDYNCAQRCFIKAKEIFPDFIPIYILSGLLQLEQHNKEEAFQTFRNLIDDNFVFTSMLINELMVKEYYDMIDKIISIIPPNDSNLINLLGFTGLEFRKRKKLNKAEEFFKKVIEIDPNIERTYFDLEEIYKVKGQITDRIHVMEELLKINPNLIECLENLLKIYNQSGDSINSQRISNSLEKIKQKNCNAKE